MTNPVFIPITESDIPTLGMLRRQVWAATYRGIYPDDMIDNFDFEWHAEKDLLRIQSPRFYHWFIQEDRKIIGYLTIRNAEYLYLYSLYLLPEAQHRGYGRQSMKFTAQLCKEKSIESFRCHCQPDNENAMQFYKKMGGIIAARDENSSERWQNTVVFEFSTADFL